MIALALRGRGYEVFLDKDKLPPGGTFDLRIKRAVDASDLFVFLISPESVAPGCYALTELAFARQKWNSPYNRVLPVMVEPTDLNDVPAYLKAVTILRPQGNVPAEVGNTVDTLLGANPVLGRVLFTAALIGVASAIASAFFYARGANPIRPIPMTGSTLLPGVAFGIAVGALVFLYGGRSQVRASLTGAIVFATWVVVIGIVLSMGQPPKEPTPLGMLRLPLPGPAPDDIFALQADIEFKIILSALVGSVGTWSAVALVSAQVRTLISVGLVLIAGMLPVFIVPLDSLFGTSLLFLLWQPSVAIALAYALSAGSPAAPEAGEPTP
jgi:hypothetical protein